MRIEYELTDEQRKRVLDASQQVRYLVANGTEPRGPRENANAVWESIGNELGFDHMTVKPVTGKDDKFFTAIETHKPKWIDIVFDGPPSHDAGRFVEVEDASGNGMKIGEWVEREDGYWVLRLDEPEVRRILESLL